MRSTPTEPDTIESLYEQIGKLQTTIDEARVDVRLYQGQARMWEKEGRSLQRENLRLSRAVTAQPVRAGLGERKVGDLRAQLKEKDRQIRRLESLQKETMKSLRRTGQLMLDLAGKEGEELLPLA